MHIKESPSFEQKKYVAAVCHAFNPGERTIRDSTTISCDLCIHWDQGECIIFDDVLTGIDQT